MKTRLSSPLAVALFVVLVGLGGCRQSHEGWEPPVEETSTRFLQQEAEEALRLVDAAYSDLAGTEGPAKGRLSEAADALRRLTVYYLPLLEARERVYNAHRFFYYGESARADAEIKTVEQILDGVVELGGARLLRVLSPAIDLVGEAQAAIHGAPEEVPQLLRDLAIKLNLATLKGELELP